MYRRYADFLTNKPSGVFIKATLDGGAAVALGVTSFASAKTGQPEIAVATGAAATVKAVQSAGGFIRFRSITSNPTPVAESEPPATSKSLTRNEILARLPKK